MLLLALDASVVLLWLGSCAAAAAAAAAVGELCCALAKLLLRDVSIIFVPTADFAEACAAHIRLTQSPHAVVTAACWACAALANRGIQHQHHHLATYIAGATRDSRVLGMCCTGGPIRQGRCRLEIRLVVC